MPRALAEDALGTAQAPLRGCAGCLERVHCYQLSEVRWERRFAWTSTRDLAGAGVGRFLRGAGGPPPGYLAVATRRGVRLQGSRPELYQHGAGASSCDPVDFFRGIPRQGDFINPLIFAIICYVVCSDRGSSACMLCLARATGSAVLSAASQSHHPRPDLRRDRPVYRGRHLHLLVMLIVRLAQLGL